jgi:hypothetical protein
MKAMPSAWQIPINEVGYPETAFGLGVRYICNFDGRISGNVNFIGHGRNEARGTDENCCAWPAELMRFICRLRRRVSWCESSAS